MASIRLKGKLNKWIDDKGFGFIKPEKSTQDIFVHISAFDKALSRKPKVGDTIYYHIHTDNKKTKAVDATIKGVALRKKKSTPHPTKHYRERGSKNSLRVFVLCLAIFIGICGFIYNRLQSGGRSIPSGNQISNFFQTSQKTKQPVSNYICEGKTHCSQMASCEEAQFYIRNCPGTKMDGDGDGVPCERQLCN